MARPVVDEGQLVLAAEITNSSVDRSHLDPMIIATITEFQQAGITGQVEIALGEAQCWNEEQMDEVIANKHIQVLIPPHGSASGKQRAGWQGGRYTWMRTVLTTEHGGDRGRSAVRTEWRSLMATHNLTKLHRHQIATVGA